MHYNTYTNLNVIVNTWKMQLELSWSAHFSMPTYSPTLWYDTSISKFNHFFQVLRVKANECIEYKLLSLTYKVLTTSQPSYLNNLISVQPPPAVLLFLAHLSSPHWKLQIAHSDMHHPSLESTPWFIPSASPVMPRLTSRRHYLPAGAAWRHGCLNWHWRDTDLILRLHFISFLSF